ncbi:MAG: DUF4381 domain-containing protein [Pseudomonadota bacterium]
MISDQSLPPLPEAFGNYVLEGMVEVVAPGSISWLPQTAGWAYLGIALLGWIAWRAGQWLKHWHRNRYRREALAEVQRLPTDMPEDEVVPALNAILKRAALASFPRPQVASLSGVDWIDFLQTQCDRPLFDAAQAALLAQGSYRPYPIDQTTRTALTDAACRWINTHRGGAV